MFWSFRKSVEQQILFQKKNFDFFFGSSRSGKFTNEFAEDRK